MDIAKKYVENTMACVGIHSDETSITIYDKKGNEIVHWVEEEWQEDEDVVISIAAAIRIYLFEGEDALKRAVGKL